MQLIQLVLSGLAQGCIYALVALGFVLIYKATETISFAQGDLMMLGAFFGFFCMNYWGAPYWQALVISVVASFALGRLLELAVVRPILGQPAFTVVMLTIGIGYVARSLITMVPVVGIETHPMPAPYRGQVFEFAGLRLAAEQAVVIPATVALCLALYLMFRFTKLGIAMQATSQNQIAAYYMGIPVRSLNNLVWGLATAVSALAGMLLAPMTFVHVNMGFIGLKALPAAVIGGFGSLPGAVVGGLLIGVVEALAGFYLPIGIKDIAAYVVVLAMLIIRPTGLFGEQLRKRV